MKRRKIIESEQNKPFYICSLCIFIEFCYSHENGYFKKYEHILLDVTPIEVFNAVSQFTCLQKCLQNYKCKAVNIESSDKQLQVKCSVLDKGLLHLDNATKTSPSSTLHVLLSCWPCQEVAISGKSEQISCDCRGAEMKANCKEHRRAGFKYDGLYRIQPVAERDGFDVLCDMSTEGGGWVVFERRINKSTVFSGKSWEEYANGFGSLLHEFWLGLEKVHLLTNIGSNKLRFDLNNGTQKAYATYAGFHISDADTSYTLRLGSLVDGDAGDSMVTARDRPFSTYDRDNSARGGHSCVGLYGGAWWYGLAVGCHESNLNAVYGSTEYGRGLTWYSLTGYYVSLNKTEMKFRPDD